MISLLFALQLSSATPGMPPEIVCAQQRAIAVSETDQPAEAAAQAIATRCAELVEAKDHGCLPEVKAICDAMALEMKAKRQAALKRSTYQMILRARFDKE
jgi:hypothetical protein